MPSWPPGSVQALVALACASCWQVITESVFQAHAVLDADLPPFVLF